MEIKVIKSKFGNADYPPKSLNSVIHQFLTPKNNDGLFEASKPFSYQLKYPIVKKTKMLPNILLRNLRHVPITGIELQLNG